MHWALDDAARDRILASANGKTATVQRFKGLGEMNPATLKQTTLDPTQRTLLRVDVADDRADGADDPDADGQGGRAALQLIMERAPKVEDVDV